MKKTLFSIFVAIIAAITINAQVPSGIKYQAVARNTEGAVLANQDVTIEIIIDLGQSPAQEVFAETHSSVKTNEFGLINLVIGSKKTAEFEAIDWTKGEYFISVKINNNVLGRSQVLSVPYALHAKTVENYTETDPAISSKFNFSGATSGDILQYNASQGKWVRTTMPEGQTLTEVDPLFTGSAANGITATNITNWTSAYSWGNHASAGYLKSYTETDKVWTAASANYYKKTETDAKYALISHNHSSLYKPLSYVPQWSEIIDKPTTFVPSAHNHSAADINSGTLPITRGGTGATTAAAARAAISAGTLTGITAGSGIKVTTSTTSPTISVKTYSVGDFAHGGVVFWVDATGQHGIVCAKVDQSTGIRWYAGTNGNTWARGDGPFAGKMNTAIIIAAHAGIGDDGATYAARICNELQITEGGKTYGDWYLPAWEELDLMYANFATINSSLAANGGTALSTAWYWSSTEYLHSYAVRVYLANGSEGTTFKSDAISRVRAVRSF